MGCWGHRKWLDPLCQSTSPQHWPLRVGIFKKVFLKAETEPSIYIPTTQMPLITGERPAGSHELRIPSKSPLWVARTWMLEPSPGMCLAKSWIRSKGARILSKLPGAGDGLPKQCDVTTKSSAHHWKCDFKAISVQQYLRHNKTLIRIIHIKNES